MSTSDSRLRKRGLRAMLSGGDRRSIGRANEAARAIVSGACASRHAVALLLDEDPLIRMRAADALEKASAHDPGLIQAFRGELVALLVQTRQQELRWHLARMLPRLALTESERRRAFAALKQYLEDRSSIVKTCALDALSRIAAGRSGLEREVLDLLQDAERNGTPAMRARARRLLKTSFS